MSTQFSINPADIWGQWAKRMAPSPTTTVKQLAGIANFFSLMTLGTGQKLGNILYYRNLLTTFADRMAAFGPRFTTAQAQELATWQSQHPTATAEEQAAFAQQQEADLSAFLGQLATWHEEYLDKWHASPLATR